MSFSKTTSTGSSTETISLESELNWLAQQTGEATSSAAPQHLEFAIQAILFLHQNGHDSDITRHTSLFNRLRQIDREAVIDGAVARDGSLAEFFHRMFLSNSDLEDSDIDSSEERAALRSVGPRRVHWASSANHVDSSEESDSEEDSEEYFDCIEPSSSPLANPLSTIIDRVQRTRRLANQLLELVSMAKKGAIWISAGTTFCNALEKLYSGDTLSRLVGVVQLGSAGYTGYSAHRAHNQKTSSTLELLIGDMLAGVDQISGLASAIEESLEQCSSSVDQASRQLDLITDSLHIIQQAAVDGKSEARSKSREATVLMQQSHLDMSLAIKKFRKARLKRIELLAKLRESEGLYQQFVDLLQNPSTEKKELSELLVEIGAQSLDLKDLLFDLQELLSESDNTQQEALDLLQAAQANQVNAVRLFGEAVQIGNQALTEVSNRASDSRARAEAADAQLRKLQENLLGNIRLAQAQQHIAAGVKEEGEAALKVAESSYPISAVAAGVGAAILTPGGPFLRALAAYAAATLVRDEANIMDTIRSMLSSHSTPEETSVGSVGPLTLNFNSHSSGYWGLFLRRPSRTHGTVAVSLGDSSLQLPFDLNFRPRLCPLRIDRHDRPAEHAGSINQLAEFVRKQLFERKITVGQAERLIELLLEVPIHRGPDNNGHPLPVCRGLVNRDVAAYFTPVQLLIEERSASESDEDIPVVAATEIPFNFQTGCTLSLLKRSMQPDYRFGTLCAQVGPLTVRLTADCTASSILSINEVVALGTTLRFMMKQGLVTKEACEKFIQQLARLDKPISLGETHALITHFIDGENCRWLLESLNWPDQARPLVCSMEKLSEVKKGKSSKNDEAPLSFAGDCLKAKIGFNEHSSGWVGGTYSRARALSGYDKCGSETVGDLLIKVGTGKEPATFLLQFNFSDPYQPAISNSEIRSLVEHLVNQVRQNQLSTEEARAFFVWLATHKVDRGSKGRGQLLSEDQYILFDKLFAQLGLGEGRDK